MSPTVFRPVAWSPAEPLGERGREDRPVLHADAPGVEDLRRLLRAVRPAGQGSQVHGPHERPERRRS